MESTVLLLVMTAATLCAAVVRAHAHEHAHGSCSYPAIFFFGDSLEDTGNGPFIDIFRATQLPYGETFPGRADLRFSDGRAMYIDLPPLNPSLNTALDFSQGVNYAIPAGATALALMPYALETQIGWHLALREEVIASGDTPGRPSRVAFDEGLYVIQMGGNDYFHYYWMEYSPQYVNVTIVPRVIQETQGAIERLVTRMPLVADELATCVQGPGGHHSWFIHVLTTIDLPYNTSHNDFIYTMRLYSNGAKHFLIIGAVPAGCTPVALVNFSGDAFDSHGCLLEYNEVSENHRTQLLVELQILRESHPDATIAFADYYAAYIHVLENLESYGFNNAFDACCGAGPHFPYGYSVYTICGNQTESLFVCNDPNTYINWDGLHYTDRFNFQIFNQTVVSRSYLYPYDGLVTCASKIIGSRPYLPAAIE